MNEDSKCTRCGRMYERPTVDFKLCVMCERATEKERVAQLKKQARIKKIEEKEQWND